MMSRRGGARFNRGRRPVAVRSAPDTAVPLVVSATTNSDGTRVILNYNENLNPLSGSNGTYTLANTASVISAIVSVAGSQVTLATDTPILESDTGITIDFTAGANTLKDLEGNVAANFAGLAVTNAVSAAVSLVSAVWSADGYSCALTYSSTPLPADDNFELTGTPEFICGVSDASNVRTLISSGPILDNETVTIDSDTLTAQATTNNSTESGSDYTTNRLVEVDARTGLTHSGDGTTITAASDQSGNGYDFGEIETGQGPVYRAAIAQMRSLPMIDCANNDALQATAAGLLTALSGNISWTYVLLWCPSGNNNNSRVCSWGIKNNASNQFVDVGSITTACNSTSTQTGNANNRTTNNLDQWQKKPLPTMTAWVCNGSTITMYAGQTNVTYDSSTFSAVVGLVPTALALGARLQAVAPTYSNGSFRFARARLYNAALTAAQLRRVGRAFADEYGISMLGCSPARALSLV